MHIVVRTNTYACRLTVLPRHSLWDVLHMVRPSAPLPCPLSNPSVLLDQNQPRREVVACVGRAGPRGLRWAPGASGGKVGPLGGGVLLGGWGPRHPPGLSKHPWVSGWEGCPAARPARTGAMICGRWWWPTAATATTGVTSAAPSRCTPPPVATSRPIVFCCDLPVAPWPHPIFGSFYPKMSSCRSHCPISLW